MQWFFLGVCIRKFFMNNPGNKAAKNSKSPKGSLTGSIRFNLHSPSIRFKCKEDDISGNINN
jgi:hypothetical protein